MEVQEINPHNKQAISERYREAVKANDVDGMDLFGAIRKRAYELGYTEEQLQEVYREVRNESSRDKQHAEPVPTTQETQPVTPEAPKADANPRAESRLRSRTQESLPSVSGLTASGTRKTGASGGKSIVDGIL